MLPRTLFRAFLGTVVPSARGLDETGWREVEEIVARALAERPARVARQVRAFLALVQLRAFVRYGRSFAALEQAQRARVLGALENSRVRIFRVGFFGVRTLALMGYWGREEAGRAIGWTPDARGLEARESAP